MLLGSEVVNGREMEGSQNLLLLKEAKDNVI